MQSKSVRICNTICQVWESSISHEGFSGHAFPDAIWDRWIQCTKVSCESFNKNERLIFGENLKWLVVVSYSVVVFIGIWERSLVLVILILFDGQNHNGGLSRQDTHTHTIHDKCFHHSLKPYVQSIIYLGLWSVHDGIETCTSPSFYKNIQSVTSCL